MPLPLIGIAIGIGTGTINLHSGRLYIPSLLLSLTYAFFTTLNIDVRNLPLFHHFVSILSLAKESLFIVPWYRYLLAKNRF